MSDWDGFLGNPDAEKVLLIRVRCYVPGLADPYVTKYLSSKTFITSPTDSPASTIFENRIIGSPYFRRAIPEVFTGRSLSAFGDILIDNSDGELDEWLTYGWDGRWIEIRLGDADWAWDDYQIILVGRVQRLVVDSDRELRLEIRDNGQALDVPVQSSQYTTGDAADLPKPLCYGQVYNITPVLIDSAAQTYQIHDGPIDSIQGVYDNGIFLALTTGYTANLTAGTITLVNNPSGLITVDCKGATPASTWLSTPGQIVNDILTRSNGIGLASGDIDSASLTTVDSGRGYALGLYIAERENAIDVLDKIATSIGAWYGFDRNGLFQMGLFDAPSGTSALEIQSSDTAGDLNTRLHDIPLWRVRCTYQKNWTVQDADGLAGAMNTSRRALVTQIGKNQGRNDGGIKTMHTAARDPDRYETLMWSGTDAGNEMQRMLDLFGVQRFMHSVRVFAKPFSVDLGDIVTLYDERFGMSGGVQCIIVGLTEYYSDNTVELELFR